MILSYYEDMYEVFIKVDKIVDKVVKNLNYKKIYFIL